MARSRGKKIDIVHWSNFGMVSLAQSVGSVAAVASIGQHLPETILRCRGSIISYLDGTEAPGTGINVGIGMHVVPAGTGTSVITAPLTDPDADWFYYTTFALIYEEYVTDVIDATGGPLFREVIDAKAMRRFPQSSELQIVIENATITGLSAGSMNTFVDGRCLSGT